MAQQFHVIFQPGTRAAWLHGTGSTLGRLKVLRVKPDDLIEFAATRLWILKLPVLFPEAAGTVAGGRAYTCVTAAGYAFIRGWLPPFQ